MADVIVETKDRVCRIEMARLEKKNALTAAMYIAMAEALDAAEADPKVRVHLLHGSPDCYTAGNDLKDFMARAGSGGPSSASRFIRTLPTLAKPLVAAVGGPAVGVGTTMLLHCDFVYCTPEARFQMPFVSLGLVPEAASSLLLPLAAGYRRAAELLMLGQPFGAERALEAGIVTEIVPKAELLERARATALGLAAQPAASVRLTKQLLKRQYAKAVAEQIEEESRHFAERLASPEAKEAMTAFFEKRKPDFTKFP